MDINLTKEGVMKFLRIGEAGQEKAALLDAQGQIRDISAVVSEINGQFIEHELQHFLQTVKLEDLPIITANTQRIGPCIANVGKLIGIGLNYSDHAAETGAALPAEPIVFNKWTSCIVGPYDTVQIPRGSVKTDWEVELGIIIGKTGQYISVEDAMQYVAGYCVINDVSERAYQIERGGSWDKGKGCDTFGPLGPYFVTKDEVPDPQALRLWLEVDGIRYQDGNTANMIFDVATLVSYLSQFMRLEAGDVIASGTPAGVGIGQKPPIFLGPGQVMRLGIDGLGEQQQHTIAAQ
jgi:2,4-diketo-3-deoxy-L-fuconate hydrolase